MSRTRFARALARLLAAAALAGAATSCRHFRPSRGLDLATFADNTVATIGNVQRFEQPGVWVYLRNHREHPAVLKAAEHRIRLARLLRGIAFYSVQMVAIGDARLPEERKLTELARHLEVVVRQASSEPEAEDWGVTPADIDRIVGEITQQTTFLDGVAAAEPLVNGSKRYGLKLVDTLDEDIAEATSAIGRAVAAEFAEVNENVAAVGRVQQRLLRGFALLHQHRLGDPQALEQLRAAVPLAREALPPGKPPSARDLDALEVQLAAQLERVETAKKQLVPDLADYERSQRELDDLRAAHVEQARLARVTLMFWAGSHRNLGRGIAVPPAIDIPGLLTSGAVGVTKAISPF